MLDFSIIAMLFQKHTIFLSCVLGLCVFIYATLWTMTGLFMVTASQGLALKSRKVFFQKIAEQQSKAVFYAHLAFTFLIGLIWAICLYLQGEGVLANVNTFIWAGIGSNFVLLGLHALYALLWQGWKNKPLLHLLYGLTLSILLFLGTILSSTQTIWLASKSLANMEVAIKLTNLPSSVDLLQTALEHLVLLLKAPMLLSSIVASVITIGLGVSAAKGGAWLIWRRTKDDFGRDYYNFALRYIGFLGMLAGALCILSTFGIVIFLQETSFAPYADFGFLYLGLAMTVATIILWLQISLNRNPLRHKITILFNNLFTFICVVLMVYFWVQFIIRLSWAQLPPI